jgi:hypothetical protein
MKRILLLLVILAFSILSKSQSKSSPGRLETIAWIKEKLETNTFYTNDIKIERSVSFDILTKTLTIEESNYYAPDGKKRITVYIPLDKLNPSSVLIDKGTDKWLVFHLILRTNNGTKDIKATVFDYYSGQQYEVYSSDVKIFITKEALLDNLDIRLKEAFSHAIRLSGGTSKEIF